jgi:hypothetical protein
MLLPIVQAALDAHGWAYEVSPDGTLCSLDLGGRTTRYLCIAWVDDALEQAGIALHAPQRIPAEARAAACEYAARVNRLLRLGNLDVDPDDGTWRFRIAVDVEGSALSPQMVDTMLACAASTMDAYHDGMLRVAFGAATPQEAAAAA